MDLLPERAAGSSHTRLHAKPQTMTGQEGGTAQAGTHEALMGIQRQHVFERGKSTSCCEIKKGFKEEMLSIGWSWSLRGWRRRCLAGHVCPQMWAPAAGLRLCSSRGTKA